MLCDYVIRAHQDWGAWLRRFTLGHIGHLNRALESVVRNGVRLSGVIGITLDLDST